MPGGMGAMVPSRPHVPAPAGPQWWPPAPLMQLPMPEVLKELPGPEGDDVWVVTSIDALSPLGTTVPAAEVKKNGYVIGKRGFVLMDGSLVEVRAVSATGAMALVEHIRKQASELIGNPTPRATAADEDARTLSVVRNSSNEK